MNKQVTAVVAIIVFLAVFIPLVSSNPDGLERVVETFGAKEEKSIWNGIMSNYTIEAIEDPYISTLLPGIFGTFTVLIAGYLIGKIIKPKEQVSQ